MSENKLTQTHQVELQHDGGIFNMQTYIYFLS